MKRFIANLLLFAILFFIYDKAFIFFKEYSADKEIDKRLELVLQGKMNKEIIVLGSSRGANAVIAGDLQKILGKSTYNLSYPASDVEFHEFLLRTLVKFNKPPKTLLLVVDDPFQLLPTNTQVFRYERLYPLVKYDHINQELIDKGQKNALLSKLFVLHRINKTNLNLRQKYFTPEATVLACGSMPISFQKSGRKWFYEKTDGVYPIADETSAKVEAFNKIISICENTGIKLILITVPNFRESNPSFVERMKTLVNERGSLYEFKYNSIYLDSNYFYDESHLNNKGAEIFTDELATYLKDKI